MNNTEPGPTVLNATAADLRAAIERAEKAEAACAEKDEVLRELYIYITTPAKCPNRKIIDHALSSDCGRGHIPASELDKTIELLKMALQMISPYTCYMPLAARLTDERTRLETLRTKP